MHRSANPVTVAASPPGSSRHVKRAFSVVGAPPIQQRAVPSAVVRNATESPVLPSARRPDGKPPAAPGSAQVSRVLDSGQEVVTRSSFSRVQQFLDSARRSRSDDRSEHVEYSPLRPKNRSESVQPEVHSPTQPPKSADLRPPRRRIYAAGQNQTALSPDLCESARAVSSDSRRPPLSSFGFAGLASSQDRTAEEQAETRPENAGGTMTPQKSTFPAQSDSPKSISSTTASPKENVGDGGQRVRRGSAPVVEPMQGAGTGELILPWWLLNSSAAQPGKSPSRSRSRPQERINGAVGNSSERDIMHLEDRFFFDGLSGWQDDGRSIPHRRYDQSQQEAHLQSHCKRVRCGAWLVPGHDELISPEALAAIDNEGLSGPREGPGISELALDFERRTECPVCADEWSKASIRLKEAGLICSNPYGETNGKNLSCLVSPCRRRVPGIPAQMHSVKCVYWWYQHRLSEGARDSRFRNSASEASKNTPVELYFGAPVSAFPPPMVDVIQHWKSVRKSENQRDRSSRSS